MMFRKKDNRLRKVVSIFIAINYLLIVLFSGELHNHPSDLFQTTTMKKSEPRFERSQSAVHNPGVCMSCFFATTNFSLVPEQFVLHLQSYTELVNEILTIQERIWSQIKFSFQLRGPPSFI